MESKNIKALFIRAFVRRLIKNTKISPIIVELKEPKKSEEPKPTSYLESHKKPLLNKMMRSPFQIGETKKIKETIVPIPRTTSKRKIIPISKGMHLSPKPTLKESFPRPEAKIPLSKPTQGNPDLGKLNFLISDPGVTNIECSGPNKNVTVNKDGAIQRTKVVLTEKEVKKIIEDFSTQTRIPLVGGTFKAALGNLIMTAVISDYVGSRFMIQKRNPFQPLVYPSSNQQPNLQK